MAGQLNGGLLPPTSSATSFLTPEQGKTAPRLIEDLNLYNPQKLPNSSFNVLTQSPPQFRGDPHRKIAKNACSHTWVLKQTQCSAYSQDNLIDLDPTQSASAFCPKCRCHLSVEIINAGGAERRPCPSPGNPLHHFVYLKSAPNGFKREQNPYNEDLWIDEQHFSCSIRECETHLVVRIKSPRLKREWVELLTSQELIRKRAERSMKEDPARFEGHTVPVPVTVLSHLRQYVNNAVQDPDRRRIMAHNKKFLLSFSDDCAEIFKFIGFTQEETGWIPPKVDVQQSAPFTDPEKILLDDVERELVVLANEQPLEQRRAQNVPRVPESATLMLQDLLGCKQYKTSLASRRNDTAEEDHPWFAGLGAVGDFHDELIIFAYDQQILYDPPNTPYYLECLQGIATGRASEDLQTKVAIEASSGKISMEDIRRAYKNLTLDPDTQIPVDTILGNFESRLSSSPKQEEELRRSLQIIGQYLGSERLQSVASNTVNSYEQALAWLGATADMNDDFITSMYGVKVGENLSNEEVARQCVMMIADHRNSSALRQWLSTGQLGEVEMDFGQAYARLSIDDRTVDDDLVLTTYKLALEEAPSQEHDLKRALLAIAKSRKSATLLEFIGHALGAIGHPLSEWPVGLKNIGNTCYLNSLLQFYFTVKPLRDLVLNFDSYKIVIDDFAVNARKVGSRKVSKMEIQRAQNFVYQLRGLFENMITAAQSEVKPEQELARLTLLTKDQEETIRRRSTISGDRPITVLDEIATQGLPLENAVHESESAVDDKADDEVKSSAVDRKNSSGQTSSDGTLVDEWMDVPKDVGQDNESVSQAEQAGVLENKENLVPKTDTTTRRSMPDPPLNPLAESSPSRINEQLPPSPPKSVKDADGDSQMIDQLLPPPPKPERAPPPVPPRRKPVELSKTKTQEYRRDYEIGAQQDVSEVIANVLFHLQCAIKPEMIDTENQEQIDVVKRLFYGKQKTWTRNKKGEWRAKEEYFSDVKVNIASGPQDIYSALDGAFDVQKVDVEDTSEPQYSTISVLPPVFEIFIHRTGFDREKNQVVKLTHPVDLKETIYMDRYMDTDDGEIISRRHECWQWKEDLAQLRERRAQMKDTALILNIPDVLKASIDYIDAFDPAEGAGDSIESGFAEDLQAAVLQVDEEADELDKKIRDLEASISSQFADMRRLAYRLQSVFIHRGSANSGHYWIYIYDFAKKLWRKYNDEYVTEVKDTKEIFQHEWGDRPSTAYFLAYVKEDVLGELVDAVCRDVPEQEQQKAEDPFVEVDAEMTDQDAAASKHMTEWAKDLGDRAQQPSAPEW